MKTTPAQKVAQTGRALLNKTFFKMNTSFTKTFGQVFLLLLSTVFLLGFRPDHEQGFAFRQMELLRQSFRQQLVRSGFEREAFLAFPPTENCSNGIDDDGDGLIDAADPDCGGNIVETIPAGSYIIDMGVQPQTVNNALKPYGLVWHLLHYFEVPVKWAINPNKEKDGIDFTYNGTAYRGGPFIISADFRTPQVDSLINAWQTQGVVGVTTTSEFTAPINRTLKYSMNWTLNKENGGIAEEYLLRAGIPEFAYNWVLPQDLDCCNDVFLMPHSEPEWFSHNRLLTWNDSEQNGGCNGAIWAGCKSGSVVENIKNPASPYQRMNFLMLDPIAPQTNPAVPNGSHADGTIPPPYSYDFHAHPVMQFLGVLDGSQENGAEQIYLPTNGWRPSTFVPVWDATHPNVPSLSPGLAGKIAFGPAFGNPNRGAIMYQGGHRLDKDTKAYNIAAQRAFLNFSLMAATKKAIHASAVMPPVLEANKSVVLTASATGGSGNYQFNWTSSCGGTFSNPYSSTTTFTPPDGVVNLDCIIQVSITDDCGVRMGFDKRMITVQGRPSPPVAVDDYESTQPGTSIIINPLANDSDPNLDPLTLTALIGPANTGNGVFVNNGNNTVTYTPDFDFVGVDQIRYRVCDPTPPSSGGPLCDTATIYITVDWSDEHGCYPNQYYGIAAEGYATGVTAQNSITNPSQALGAPVLVNSSNSYYAKIDNDGDYLVLDLGYNVPVGDTIWLYIGSDDASSATLRVQGTLNSNNHVNGNGYYDLRTYVTNKDLNDANPQQDVVAYVPATGAVRRLRFTRATGAGKPCVNGVRYVDMECLSAVPVANNDAVTLCEDNTVNIDVLANDSDPQDLPLSVSILTQPLHGTINVLTDGTVRYKPDADYSGTDNFTYQACNPNNLCDPATVNITIYDDNCPPGYYKVSVNGVCSGNCVLSPNNPPDAADDYTTTPLNTPVTVNVQSNDIDPSGLGITTFIGISNPPDNGSVLLDGKNIRYTPNTGFTGQDVFNYKVCNPYGCDSALVTVDVLCVDPGEGRAIQGMVFRDVNKSATYDDGEAGFSNISIRLFTDINGNGLIDAGDVKIDSTLTDNLGNYTFSLTNGGVQNSNSQTYYAIAATGSVDKPGDYPLTNATGAPDGTFVKLNSGKYVVLDFGYTIPAGNTVNIFLASDKKDGKADITSSLDGITYGNLTTWTATYTKDPGNPPPASAYQKYSYQVATATGVRFVKIARNSSNIYVDAGSYVQTTGIGTITTYSISRAINAGTDDAEEEGADGANLGAGAMQLNDTDLEITQDIQSPSKGTQKIGLRFNSINIPPGATITSASLVFSAIGADAPNTNNGATSLTITGEATDHASTFTTAINNISGRSLTAASSSWNPPAWSSGTTQTSPDLSAIVQEIVNRPGWAVGNSMAFVITGTGSRSANSYNGSPSAAPVLKITYTVANEVTSSLSVLKDNQITQGSNINYGTSQALESYNSGGIVRRPLFKFDLSNIPANAVITSASMELYASAISTNNTPVKAHRLTADWDQGSANASTGVSNWTQRLASPATNWTTAGGDYHATAAAGITTTGSTAGTYTFNLTNLVQSWVNGTYTNHGVILLNDPGFAGVSWRSKEWTTAAQQPKLVVRYTVPPVNNFILQLNTATLPPAGTLTTDNVETAVVINPGDVDCANNFGIINHLPPVGVPDTAFVPAGVSALIKVIENDYDPEGTPLTMTILTNPPNGTAVNNQNGSLTFTSGNGFLGWQTFFYKICDAGTPSLCDTTTVTINVIPFANRRPEARDDYDTTFVNIDIETEVLENDLDLDYDNMNVSLTQGIQQPSHGTIHVVNGKRIEYHPNPGFTGDDQYQYIVCDQQDPPFCDTARVFIHVKNNPPDARDDVAITEMNASVNIPVLVNDVEIDGHGIVLLSAGTDAFNGQTKFGGTVSIMNAGTPSNPADDYVLYTPPSGFVGVDTFQYRIRDTGTPWGYDIARVIVNVTSLIDLELQKTVNPAEAVLGQNVTFTLTLLNKGPGTATTILTKDKLTFSYLYVSDNGNGAYDPITGLWYIASLGPGQSRTLSITAKILNPNALKNVAEVYAVVQKDVDSRPNNDDGDQSEDDEDSATPDLIEICNDGLDNDGDGLTDCNDPDCGVLDVQFTTGNGTTGWCPGTTSTITASASGSYAPFTYAWSHGLGTGATKTITPLSTTTYTVTVTNTSGCTATGQRTITVYSAPTVNAGADVSVCNGSSTVLDATGSGGSGFYIYTWSHGLGAGQSKTVAPTSNTTYTVTITDSNGCTGTDQVVVTVRAVAPVNAGADATICSGSSTTLSASASGGTGPYTFDWSHGLGTGASKTVSPTSTTTYTVTVTNGQNCTSTDNVVVNVLQRPVANAGADVTICRNFGTTLTASATGGTAPYTYNWSNSLGTSATVAVTPTATTTYTVTVTSANGCNQADQVVVTVVDCNEDCTNGLDDDGDGLIDCADSDCKPVPTISGGATICIGTGTSLTASVSGGGSYTYTWSNGLGTGDTKTVNPSSTTTYTVTVTNSAGCTGTAQATVTVTFCPEDCDNGIDDDGDGLIDCEDPDCVAIAAPQLVDDYFTVCPGLPFSDRVSYNDGNLQDPVFSIYSMPLQGTVSIDDTGKIVYTPLTTDCLTDVFEYQVCNNATGCCATATVYLTIGDNTPPVLTNVPADLTISCDDAVPSPPVVLGFDGCPGIYIEFDEATNQYTNGACETYNITRTWTATDLCGNYSTGTQTIIVEDQTAPELFRLYTLPNGKKLAGGVAQRTTENWKYVPFPVTFTQTPLVFAQVVTKEENTTVAVSMRNVTKQGFEMRLREEEANDGSHFPEEVAWLAIEPGSVTDSFQLRVGKLTGVDHTSKSLTFTQPFADVPAMIASVQTSAEEDPVTVRFQSITTTGASLFLQEEASKDQELTHALETVGYLAFDRGLTLKDEDGFFIGETGDLTLTNAWAHVTLDNSYTKPVVILGGLTNNDGAPATLRVRNVTANSFEVRVEEWNYLDGNHSGEKLSYLVMEGSIPHAPSNYCKGNAAMLQNGVNIFVRDNCDFQLSLDFEESSSMQPGQGLLVSRSWTSVDDCGNQMAVSRYDTCAIAAVRIKALLHGALIGNNAGNFLMRDDLRKNGLLPTTEPYTNLSGFQHKGSGGGETVDPAVFSVTGNNAIVDWVFVELRDPGNGKTILATQSALLQRDGDVVSIDGDSVLYFPTLGERNYYVVLRHRNHLGVMTDSVRYLTSENAPLVDFTDMTVQIEGGNTGARLLNGKRALWSGDLSGDRKVIYQGPSNDVFNLFSRVLADQDNTGFLANFIEIAYDRHDLNMDGRVIYQGPNNDRSYMLFHTILSHPDNTANLANFIVSEKLP